MANYFDQFDDPDKKSNPGQNFFDQFDQPNADSAPRPPPSFTDRLMSHLAAPFQGAGQAADDYVRTITDAATFGGADRFASWAGGTKLDEERGKTEAGQIEARLDVGAADMIGYYVSPIGVGGRIAEGAGVLGRGVLGAIGRGAAEGAVAGGTSAVGHDQNIPAQIVRGGVFGAGGGALGGLLSRDIPKGVPAPLTKDLMDAKNAAYDALGGYRYSPSDLQALNTAVQAEAKQAGISELGTPGAHGFYQDFGQRVRNANAPISMQELRDIRDRAYQRSGSQTEFGDIFNKHLDDFFENSHPIGSTADEASDALDAANAANKRYKNSQMLDQWQYDAAQGGASVPSQAGEYLRGSDSREFLSSDQRAALEAVNAGTPLSSVGDFASSHAYRLGHLAGFGMLGAAGAAGAGHEFMPLVEGSAALGMGYPALSYFGEKASKWANAPLVDAARRSLTDTPYTTVRNPAVSDALRALLFGGALGY